MAPKLSVKNCYRDLDRSLKYFSQNQDKMLAARKIVDRALKQGGVHYGINTGLGKLANKVISNKDVKRLQKNLLLSHAVGVGEKIPKKITEIMLRLKIHSLGLGHSGLSKGVFERLIYFARNDMIPVVPTRGSVGASGDLAPLTHMSLPLIGLGEFWDEKGKYFVPAEKALEERKIRPVELQAKDGLSLINGTQMMLAYGVYVIEKSLRLLKQADLIAAMSLEALQGSMAPFDERVHKVRPHAGGQTVAENIRSILVESEILDAHRNCGKVQDPYCLRCVPQVHGASRDALDHVCKTLNIEMNSVTDNPLVFDDGSIISGGNFHGQPLALGLDFAGMALAELANISERRTYLLLEGHDGLPKLLMKETGINSGFMIPQYTAASLVSENKVLCHPASVDSIPTSLGQEDHVSMGSISALKLRQIYKNVELVLCIELLTACQALDYRKPLRPGLGARLFHDYIREKVPHREKDDYLKDELNKLKKVIRSGEGIKIVEKACGRLK